MFERFTQDAREVVIRAHQVARDLKNRQIGSEHLLLSIAQDDGVGGQVLRTAGVDPGTLRTAIKQLDGPAHGLLTEADAEALRSVGIDLDAVLARIEESFGPDALAPTADRHHGRRRSPNSRFGADAKKSLQLGLREAIRLRQREINTGHLLLGLIRDGGSRATRALEAVGMSVTDLRAAVEAALRRAA